MSVHVEAVNVEPPERPRKALRKIEDGEPRGDAGLLISAI